MGGRLIHEVDLYTSKYGKFKVDQSKEYLFSNDHNSTQLALSKNAGMIAENTVLSLPDVNTPKRPLHRVIFSLLWLLGLFW